MEQSGFEIRQTTSKGRSLFAAQTFTYGDTILIDKPFVSAQFCWNAAYNYSACEYCIKPLETAEMNVKRLSHDSDILLPYTDSKKESQFLSKFTSCNNCMAKYCSEECRLQAQQLYHAELCIPLSDQINHPLFKLIDVWKNVHYPPETTSIMIICKLMNMIKQAPNRNDVIDILKNFQSSTFNNQLLISHRLLGEEAENQLSKLFPYFCEVFKSDEFDIFRTPDAFKTLFAIIGINGQGIGSSPFADWQKEVAEKPLSDKENNTLQTLIDDLYEKLEDATGTQFLDTEGSGLYTTQSMINHSCAPNAEIQFPFSNHILAVKAIKQINTGDEICTSYLDDCTLKSSRHTRQKVLKENYLFICQCSLCILQQDEPDVTSDEEDSAGDEEMDI